MENNHFKNKPRQNWYSGIFTGLFYACFFSALWLGFDLLDAYTSLTGWTTEVRENIPIFFAFLIGAIVFFILKRIFDKSTFEEIERNLDD